MTPIKYDAKQFTLLLGMSSEVIRFGRNESLGDKSLKVGELFEVVYGTNLELIRLEQDSNGINFVSRTSKNNGVSARVKRISNIEPNPAKVLSVAGGGSVLETFLQLEPFYSGRDLFYLKPRTNLTIEELLFYCTVIKANQFRFNYGRQANKSLPFLSVPAPDSIPTWVYGGIKNVIHELKDNIES